VIIEPAVFSQHSGQIKAGLGFRTFLLRSLDPTGTDIALPGRQPAITSDASQRPP
jgi:hypothetical protein